MFDLIGGTSTGGILATALGVKDYTLTQCDAMYSNLGHKVSRPRFRCLSALPRSRVHTAIQPLTCIPLFSVFPVRLLLLLLYMFIYTAVHASCVCEIYKQIFQ